MLDLSIFSLILLHKWTLSATNLRFPVYIEGSQAIISKPQCVFFISEDRFCLSKQCRCDISSGPSLFTIVHV